MKNREENSLWKALYPIAECACITGYKEIINPIIKDYNWVGNNDTDDIVYVSNELPCSDYFECYGIINGDWRGKSARFTKSIFNRVVPIEEVHEKLTNYAKDELGMRVGDKVFLRDGLNDTIGSFDSISSSEILLKLGKFVVSDVSGLFQTTLMEDGEWANVVPWLNYAEHKIREHYNFVMTETFMAGRLGREYKNIIKGRWHESISSLNSNLVYCTEEDSHINGFFDGYGYWTSQDNYNWEDGNTWNKEYFKPISNEKAYKKLCDYARSTGYKEGVTVKCLNNGKEYKILEMNHCGVVQALGLGEFWAKGENRGVRDGVCLMRDGKWADIVENTDAIVKKGNWVESRNGSIVYVTDEIGDTHRHFDGHGITDLGSWYDNSHWISECFDRTATLKEVENMLISYAKSTIGYKKGDKVKCLSDGRVHEIGEIKRNFVLSGLEAGNFWCVDKHGVVFCLMLDGKWAEKVGYPEEGNWCKLWDKGDESDFTISPVLQVINVAGSCVYHTANESFNRAKVLTKEEIDFIKQI